MEYLDSSPSQMGFLFNWDGLAVRFMIHCLPRFLSIQHTGIVNMILNIYISVDGDLKATFKADLRSVNGNTARY